MNPLYRCAFDRKKCFGYRPPPVEEHEEHSYCSETNVRRSYYICRTQHRTQSTQI